MLKYNPGFDYTPVLLELMGRGRMAGYLTTMLEGAASAESQDIVLFRLDRPKTTSHEQCTIYFAPGAVYAITPISEEKMRKLAEEINTYVIHQHVGTWGSGEWVAVPDGFNVRADEEEVVIASNNDIPF